MLWHLVLMKPKPDLSDADRAAFIAAFEHALATIPTVRDVRVGRRVMHGAAYEHSMPDAADYVAAIAFDDVAGLRTYLSHPAHADLGMKFGEALSSALVYDFDLVGLDDLARRAKA
jgi:stress responsive alpha/beta barrel protein